MDIHVSDLDREGLRALALSDPQRLRLIPLADRDLDLLCECVTRHPSSAPLVSKLAPPALKDRVRDHAVSCLRGMITDLKLSQPHQDRVEDRSSVVVRMREDAQVRDLLASPYARLAGANGTAFLEAPAEKLPETTPDSASRLGWFRQTRHLVRTVVASAVLAATMLNPLAAQAQQSAQVAAQDNQRLVWDITRGFENPAPPAGVEVEKSISNGKFEKLDVSPVVEGMPPSGDFIKISSLAKPAQKAPDGSLGRVNRYERDLKKDFPELDGLWGEDLANSNSKCNGAQCEWSGGEQLPLQELDNAVKYTIEYMGFDKKDAEKLVVMLREISAQESDRGQLVRQVGGPALSIYQIEPKTYESRWFLPQLKKNYPLQYEKLQSLYRPDMSEEWHRTENLLYTTGCAAMYVKQNIIDRFNLDTLEGRARGYKIAYNTEKGKGTPEGYMKKAQAYIYDAARRDGVDLSAPLQDDVRAAFDRHIAPHLIHSPMDAMQHIADGGRYSLVPDEFRTDCLKNQLVARDGMNIAQLDEADRTPERKLAAVQNNPHALSVIPADEQTEEVIRVALEKDPRALRHADKSKVDMNAYCETVSRDNALLQEVPEHLRAEVERLVDEEDRLGSMLALR